jgi:hypothetical protein
MHFREEAVEMALAHIHWILPYLLESVPWSRNGVKLVSS